MAEGSLAISTDLGGKSIEVDDVFVDPTTVLHGEMVELVLRISDWVMQTEVGGEFEYKLRIAIDP